MLIENFLDSTSVCEDDDVDAGVEEEGARRGRGVEDGTPSSPVPPPKYRGLSCSNKKVLLKGREAVATAGEAERSGDDDEGGGAEVAAMETTSATIMGDDDDNDDADNNVDDEASMLSLLVPLWFSVLASG